MNMQHYMMTVDGRAEGKRRLLVLASHLYQLKGGVFDFSTWVGDDWAGKQDLSCGTVACALGHACAIPEFQKLGLYMDKITLSPAIPNRGSGLTAAQTLFHLDASEASYLFMPNHFNGLSDESTAKQVADNIRSFVQQGGLPPHVLAMMRPRTSLRLSIA